MRQQYSTVKQLPHSHTYTEREICMIRIGKMWGNPRMHKPTQRTHSNEIRQIHMHTVQTRTHFGRQKCLEWERERISDTQWENICCVCADWGLVKYWTVSSSSTSADVSTSSVRIENFGFSGKRHKHISRLLTNKYTHAKTEMNMNWNGNGSIGSNRNMCDSRTDNAYKYNGNHNHAQSRYTVPFRKTVILSLSLSLYTTARFVTFAVRCDSFWDFCFSLLCSTLFRISQCP